MPICFGVWYLTATLWTWPIAWVANAILQILFPTLIAGVEHVGTTLDIVTCLGDLAQYATNKTMAALVFTLNAQRLTLNYFNAYRWYLKNQQ